LQNGKSIPKEYPEEYPKKYPKEYPKEYSKEYPKEYPKGVSYSSTGIASSFSISQARSSFRFLEYFPLHLWLHRYS